MVAMDVSLIPPSGRNPGELHRMVLPLVLVRCGLRAHCPPEEGIRLAVGDRRKDLSDRHDGLVRHGDGTTRRGFNHHKEDGGKDVPLP